MEPKKEGIVRDFMESEEVEMFEEILDSSEEFRPLINKAVKMLKSFRPELAEIPELLSDWIVDKLIRAVKRYEEAGFNRQDAITMTLYDGKLFSKAVEKVSANYSKRKDG